MSPDIDTYHQNLEDCDKVICQLLVSEIDRGLPTAESKIWHAHPVWFLDGNPIVGYSKDRRINNCLKSEESPRSSILEGFC